MMRQWTFVFALILLCTGISCNRSVDNQSNQKNLNLSNLELKGEVDERYQSVNVEMCEVVGGDFWIPYDLLDSAKVAAEGFAALKWKIAPIDLYNKKIRTLAGALGPMYVRVSGTWANTTYFQDDDQPKLSEAPDGFENVLSRSEWKGVIDFCDDIDARLVTSFAISEGIRDKDGNWTPVQIKPLIEFTKEIGGEIAAAEMFNEPNFASFGGTPDGYDASSYARDFEAFRGFVSSAMPNMKILGPGSTGEGGILAMDGPMSTDSIMTAVPNPHFDIFSYHFYGGVSGRCMGGLTPDNALTEEWLNKTELGLKFYQEARDKYQPGIPIWLTETAEAACGGDPWAATYIDCFRYLEQLGRLAKKGVKVVMHNTLATSEYALLEQETLDPRPNYWAALIWSRLMGTRVYDAGQWEEGPDVFAHNLKGSTRGMAVLIVNPKNAEFTVNIPANAEQYMLTADELEAKEMRLNGEVLELTPDDEIPDIIGKRIKKGTLVLPAYSITFLSFKKPE